PTPTPTPPGTIGSGSDTITLTMSEDADGPVGAAGRDAEFTLNVDGQQIGGLQTVTASHASGQTQKFTFQGNYAPGQHVITITFANNSQTPGDKGAFDDGGDRNLYVNSVIYDGSAVSTSVTGVYESPGVPPDAQPAHPGNAVFTVNDTTAVPANAPSTPSTTPAPITSGSGPDTLTLAMSEDPYQGDAQFTVAVDGTQVGGTFTTTAIQWEGQQQQFVLKGNWGAGAHTVTVTFLNDLTVLNSAGQGIDAEDRNLFVDGVTYDGQAASGTPWGIYSNGSQDFSIAAGASPAATTMATAAVAATAAPDPTLNLTDDTGATASLAAITSGSSASAGSSLGLDGNVQQVIDSQGVDNVSTDTFGQGIVSLGLTDTSGGSYHLSNFMSTNAELGGASAGSLTIDGAAGGTVTLDSGNYTVGITAQPDNGGSAAQNQFTVTLGGSGNDTLSIDDSGTFGIASNVVHAGSGTDVMTFVGAGANTVYGGSGAATVTADSGTNSFIAGSGSMDVTGGSDASAYTFHAGDGLLTIEDFSTAGGDTLTVDKALQASMTETSDGNGGTMIGFGSAGHGIDLVGVATLPASQVRFA
ncbi:MAG TPA: carbohydrate-binding domain-containing protein, partial [Acetobacteraceae bacterium]|nr:carbohydrate-binding domain-containing protein [Acetobacteraceae bacterium]